MSDVFESKKIKFINSLDYIRRKVYGQHSFGSKEHEEFFDSVNAMRRILDPLYNKATELRNSLKSVEFEINSYEMAAKALVSSAPEPIPVKIVYNGDVITVVGMEHIMTDEKDEDGDQIWVSVATLDDGNTINNFDYKLAKPIKDEGVIA